MPSVVPPAKPWTAVHAEFPVNERMTWLNNCGISVMPTPVLAAMQRYYADLAAGGILAVRPEAVLHRSIRQRLAPLIGATVDEVTLVHHTTEGLTFLSHGIDLRPGDRIVLLENEYPSNVYPWEHWRSRGVEIVFAPLGPTPDQFLDGLTALLTPTTRVVSVSAVHWCTGMPLPLAAIGALCQERGIDFIVDGAQGVGVIPIDVQAMKITAMAFSAWKWLLGPVGVGGLYIRRDRLDSLRFPFKGTASVTDDERYLPYRDTLKTGADRYVLSTPNTNDWVYLDASLAYLDALGFPAVMARIQTLARYLVDQLRAAGFTMTSDAFPQVPTGIVAASRPGLDAAALVRTLMGEGIVAAERLGRVRLAPHVYLLEAQLDRAVERIVQLAG